MENLRIYGLIGYPLGHSFSKKYFTGKFFDEGIENAVYENFPLNEIEAFEELICDQKSLCGLNVTIPFKEAILPFLDDLSYEAAAIGAVNCISIRDGVLKGHNTDHAGFSQSLQGILPDAQVKALVLGTGGSSKAVSFALEKLGISYLQISRSNDENKISYDQIDSSLIEEYQLIVNTTPLGMFPDTEAKPDLPYDALSERNILFDLIYNPEESLFLSEGIQRGARVKNGYEMLCLQAELSWQIWNES